MKHIFLTMLILICCTVCGEVSCDKNAAARLFNYPVSIDGPFTWQEVEDQDARMSRDAGLVESVPFGRQNSEWEEIKQNISPGDCLFHYRSDEESWNKLSGREGYILIRRGRPVAGILVRMS